MMDRQNPADRNFLKAIIGLVSFVLFWFGLVRVGKKWFGQVRLGQKGYVWLDLICLVQFGQVRLYQGRSCQNWLDFVWFGSVWCIFDRFGLAI